KGIAFFTIHSEFKKTGPGGGAGMSLKKKSYLLGSGVTLSLNQSFVNAANCRSKPLIYNENMAFNAITAKTVSNAIFC
ncbi:MAG: hypothetical protein EBR59_09385, partial [Methylococcaceae bacterium]|nr:hypothetical protein [Methylococcaceae bacterium]